MGWRNECYEIRNKFEDPTLFRLERAASPLMGVRKYGIQINGFVRHKKLGTCLWFQQRSLHKPTWPGILLIETKEGVPQSQTYFQKVSKRFLKPISAVVSTKNIEIFIFVLFANVHKTIIFIFT